MTEAHQGFTNYETFSIGVVVDSDEGSYTHAREFVRELRADLSNLPNFDAQPEELREAWLNGQIADQLRDYFEASMPELDGFWSSLLSAGFGKVDWIDLAEHWNDTEWLAEQTV